MFPNSSLQFIILVSVLSVNTPAHAETVAPSSLQTVADEGVETVKIKMKPIKLLGSSEIRSRSTKSFAKWAEMWRRHNLPRSEQAILAQPHSGQLLACSRKNAAKCGREAWDSFIESQRGVDFSEMLRAVNIYMNRSRYIVDPVNWGIPDYWETPDEFFLRNGDCEDYAISKYVTLKRLGVDPATMRLVILQDENLRVAHAVLAVYVDGEYMILDNQVNMVISDTKIRHYRPVYSINETGWWLHHRRRFTRPGN
ncbi:MAG: transglutaminase-like cysteine peptidase [Kordiimonadaceae bacterium]|nr:transglutaminase-like cysteine peptidase [Kordiimonadaceae bacterium]